MINRERETSLINIERARGRREKRRNREGERGEEGEREGDSDVIGKQRERARGRRERRRES